jgi:hypothetical protein
VVDPVVLAYVYPVDPEESCLSRYHSLAVEAYNEPKQVRTPPAASHG